MLHAAYVLDLYQLYADPDPALLEIADTALKMIAYPC
jgi:hypothetical protein